MKSKVVLTDFLPHLPDEIREGLDKSLGQAECPPELHRAVTVCALDEDGDRKFKGYASTRTVDRDGEVVMPQGMDLTQFRKSPVLLWGHKWSEPPVGHDPHIECDGFGILAHSQMAETALARDLWQLVKAQMLKTSSIGFIPLEYRTPQSKEWGGMMDEMRKWPEWEKGAEPQAVVTRAVMLEHSLVSVPANIDALITSVKQLGLTELAKAIAPRERNVTSGGIHDIYPNPSQEPVKYAPRLVKSAEQVRAELEIEVQRLIADEISRRMGRV